MATKLKPVDVAIVGVGLTGTILAKELAESGLKVVGLERGRWRDTSPDFAMPYAHDELRFVGRHELMQDLSKETITFRNAPNETALPMRQLGSFRPGEGVGGAAVHWGGLTWRFLPWDFETRSRTLDRYGAKQIAEDCTSQDWGVTYPELERHFDRFEHLYGISGKAGNLKGKIVPGGNRDKVGWKLVGFPGVAAVYTPHIGRSTPYEVEPVSIQDIVDNVAEVDEHGHAKHVMRDDAQERS